MPLLTASSNGSSASVSQAERVELLLTSENLGRVLEVLLDVALELIEGHQGSVMFLDPRSNELFIRAARGLKEEIVQEARIRLDNSLAGHAILHQRPLILETARAPADLVHLLRQPDVHTSVIVPLRDGEEVLGTLNVARRDGRSQPVTQDTVEELDRLARLVTSAIRQIMESDHRAKELTELQQVMEAMRSVVAQRGLDSVLTALRQVYADFLRGPEVVVVCPLPGTGELRWCPSATLSPALTDALGATIKARHLTPPSPPMVECASDLTQSDYGAHVLDREWEGAPQLASLGYGSLALVRLVGDRGLVGSVALLRTATEGFTQDELRLAAGIASHAAGTVEYALVHEELEHLAFTDPVTKVSTRKYFEQRLAEEMARHSRTLLPVSLLMVDVDFLKRINDRYGHPVGDQVLHGVADVLRSHVRGSDLVARFGGDEFTVLLPGSDTNAALEVAERMSRGLERVPLPNHQEPPVSVSVGIASAPEHAQTGQALVEKADQALYLAKRSGRNQVSVYK